MITSSTKPYLISVPSCFLLCSHAFVMKGFIDAHFAHDCTSFIVIDVAQISRLNPLRTSVTLKIFKRFDDLDFRYNFLLLFFAFTILAYQEFDFFFAHRTFAFCFGHPLLNTRFTKGMITAVKASFRYLCLFFKANSTYILLHFLTLLIKRFLVLLNCLNEP